MARQTQCPHEDAKGNAALACHDFNEENASDVKLLAQEIFCVHEVAEGFVHHLGFILLIENVISKKCGIDWVAYLRRTKKVALCGRAKIWYISGKIVRIVGVPSSLRTRWLRSSPGS